MNDAERGATRLSMVLDGRAETGGEIVFTTSTATFTQTINAGDTAVDVVEQLSTIVSDAGYSVSGPSPAAGRGVAMYVYSDDSLVPASSGRTSLTGANRLTITSLDSRRIFPRTGFGGSPNITWVHDARACSHYARRNPKGRDRFVAHRRC